MRKGEKEKKMNSLTWKISCAEVNLRVNSILELGEKKVLSCFKNRALLCRTLRARQSKKKLIFRRP